MRRHARIRAEAHGGNFARRCSGFVLGSWSSACVLAAYLRRRVLIAAKGVRRPSGSSPSSVLLGGCLVFSAASCGGADPGRCSGPRWATSATNSGSTSCWSPPRGSACAPGGARGRQPGRSRCNRTPRRAAAGGHGAHRRAQRAFLHFRDPGERFRTDGRGRARHRRQRRLDRRHERGPDRAPRPATFRRRRGQRAHAHALDQSGPDRFACSRCPSSARAASSTPRWRRRRTKSPSRWTPIPAWRPARSPRSRPPSTTPRRGGAAGSCTCATPPARASVARALPVLGIPEKLHVAHRPGAPGRVPAGVGGVRRVPHARAARTRRLQRAQSGGGLRNHLPPARAPALGEARLPRGGRARSRRLHGAAGHRAFLRASAHALVHRVSANDVGVPPHGRQPAHGGRRLPDAAHQMRGRPPAGLGFLSLVDPGRVDFQRRGAMAAGGPGTILGAVARGAGPERVDVELAPAAFPGPAPRGCPAAGLPCTWPRKDWSSTGSGRWRCSTPTVGSCAGCSGGTSHGGFPPRGRRRIDRVRRRGVCPVPA